MSSREVITVPSKKTAAKLAEVVERWKNAKQAENAAKDARLAAEGQIIDIVGDRLKRHGTNNLEGGIKITTTVETKWDQQAVQTAADNWPEELSSPFPFRQEWKPIGKDIAYVKENLPDTYKTFLEGACTEEDRKPTFSMD
jgi:hypothetical protein